MNMNEIDQNPAGPNVPLDQNFGQELDPHGPMGPIELSILERVENGLIYSEDDAPSQENKSLESDKNKNKYEGPKEIIFVSGWININSVYKRYFWGFLSKIVIGNFPFSLNID